VLKGRSSARYYRSAAPVSIRYQQDQADQTRLIFTDVVGGSNVAFYKQIKAAGVRPVEAALLTISVTEDEIDVSAGKHRGRYAA